jgi:dTDP-4-amino-4,6-dideoxygalactose transaminase
MNPIAISLSPNTSRSDVIRAFFSVLKPWKWKRGDSVNKVTDWFKEKYQSPYTVSFNAGRSALFSILQAFDIHSGDEIIVQAFTCVAVPNAVYWTGATPVYADIDESLNIDPESFRNKITPRTKAVIVQHTFGIPAQIDKILAIASKNHIYVIEDCAHSLGGSYKKKILGSWGDAAFFSFGRDKIISSVFGGIGFIHKKHKDAGKRLVDIYNKLPYPSSRWIFQQLLHPIAFAFILPIYSIMLGKLLLYILISTRILSKPVDCIEMIGKKPNVYPTRYPNGLASILLGQLKILDAMNRHRIKLAAFYYNSPFLTKEFKLPVRIEGSVYLRFNIRTKKSRLLWKSTKEKGVLLGNWYHSIIDPSGTNLATIGYKKSSCPNAERAAADSLNLPTYIRINENDAQKVIDLLI